MGKTDLYRLILIVFSGLILKNELLAQCGTPVAGTQLQVVNPSFEGPPLPHVTPGPWNTCGVTPDTQPGSWGVNLPPSQGNSYVGFVNGGPAWQEGASQALSGNMVAGTQYTFTIDLANTPTNQGGIVPGPSVMLIYGGFANCQQTELLWTSPVIQHNNWQTYTVTFTPTQNYSNIYFQISLASGQNAYILLDNITPIVPSVPTIEITSHISGQMDGCEFVLSGTTSQAVDSVEITGNFTGSPLLATLNGTSWSETLDFTAVGTQLIYARLYYFDPVTNVQLCAYDSVFVDVSGPVVDFGYANHCFGNAANFTDNSTINGVGTLQDWDWDFGDGTGATNLNPTHTYAAPGTYDVVLTVTDANGCSNELEQQITVNPVPTADFDYVNACDDAAVTFTSTSNVASGTVAQTLWDVQGDGTDDYTTAAGSHTYPAAGDYDMTLVAVSDSGCRDTVTQTVTVYPVPTADFDYVNACDDAAVTFTSTSNVASGTVAQTLWDVQGDGTDDYTTVAGSHTYPAAGDYDMTLVAVTDNGCRDTLTQTVTVYPLPVSDFDFVNACDDLAVTFTSTSNVSSGTVDGTLWDVESDGTDDYTTPAGSHTYPANGTYDVTLVAVTDNGCRDTLTQTVTVYPLPVADFDYVNACGDAAVTFTSTSTVSSGTVDQTLWDVESDGTDDYTTAAGSHTYPADGSYDVTLVTVTDNGCRDTLTQTVTVYPLPVADFDFVNACDDAAVTFTSTSTVSSGTVDQTLWDVQSDGTDDYTTAAGSHTYPTHGSYDVTLVVVTDNACRDTLTQTIVVYPLPVAAWNAAPVCMEDTSVFVDASTVVQVDNDVIDQWEWTFGDGNSSTAQNPTHTYADENVYNTQLVVITNHGCSDTLAQNVTVWPLPVVDFSPTDVCLDFLTDFQDQSTVSNDHTANTVVQWLWNFGDGNGGTSTAQNPSYAFSVDGTFNTQLTVTSNNGCVGTVTLPVTVHPKPAVSFTGTNLAGCAPLCAQLASTSTVGGTSTIVGYTWALSNGEVYTADTPAQTVCFGNETNGTLTFGVQLTAITDKGCQDTFAQANYISVYHNPTADFYADPDVLTTTSPTTHFVNQSGFADSYNWSFGDGSIASEPNPDHTYPGGGAGTYIVTLLASTANGCVDTATRIVQVNDELLFYIPNVFTPNNDNLNTEFKPIFSRMNDPQEYVLYIFNRWGERIFESHQVAEGWDGTYRGKMSPSEVYVWRIVYTSLINGEQKSLVGHVTLLR